MMTNHGLNQTAKALPKTSVLLLLRAIMVETTTMQTIQPLMKKTPS